jgi:hypothetical protein
MPSKDINQYNRLYYQRNRERLLEKQAEKTNDSLKIEESGWWNIRKL